MEEDGNRPAERKVLYPKFPGGGGVLRDVGKGFSSSCAAAYRRTGPMLF